MFRCPAVFGAAAADEAPRPKFQVPRKDQIPSAKTPRQRRLMRSRGAWSFELIAHLELGLANSWFADSQDRSPSSPLTPALLLRGEGARPASLSHSTRLAAPGSAEPSNDKNVRRRWPSCFRRRATVVTPSPLNKKAGVRGEGLERLTCGAINHGVWSFPDSFISRLSVSSSVCSRTLLPDPSRAATPGSARRQIVSNRSP